MEKEWHFGPLGRKAYLRYAPPPPNDPHYALEKIISTFSNADDANVSARLSMWTNYDQLRADVRSSTDGLVLSTIERSVRAKSSLAERQFAEPRQGLGQHLQEVRALASSLLIDDAGRSKFPAILSDREAGLVSDVVAPLHDVLKYLGTPAAQVAPDHEVMTAELVREVFVGKKVVVAGKETALSQDDVEFVSAVVGDHENLEKELERERLVSSPMAADRAKAVFFVADTLAGAFAPADGGPREWSLTTDGLWTRFGDLYFRHMDPVVRKIFRPEWGAASIRTLVATLTELERHGGRFRGSDGSSYVDAFRSTALEAIERTLSGNEARLTEAARAGSQAPDKVLSPAELRRINEARAVLESL